MKGYIDLESGSWLELSPDNLVVNLNELKGINEITQLEVYEDTTTPPFLPVFRWEKDSGKKLALFNVGSLSSSGDNAVKLVIADYDPVKEVVFAIGLHSDGSIIDETATWQATVKNWAAVNDPILRG